MYILFRYLMLSYFNTTTTPYDIPPLFFLSSTLGGFKYNFGDYEMKMSDSNVIERTMYYGRINEEGRIVEVIDLRSNTFENPYTSFTDINYNICSNSKIIESKNTIKIGLISKKSFDNDYYLQLYRGFELELNSYNQNVYNIYIYFTIR